MRDLGIVYLFFFCSRFFLSAHSPNNLFRFTAIVIDITQKCVSSVGIAFKPFAYWHIDVMARQYYARVPFEAPKSICCVCYEMYCLTWAWMDFVYNLPHCENISNVIRISFRAINVYAFVFECMLYVCVFKHAINRSWIFFRDLYNFGSQKHFALLYGMCVRSGERKSGLADEMWA